MRLQWRWNPKQNCLPLPKFRLGGHNNEVCIAEWSSQARHLVTLDDKTLRVWEERQASGREREIWEKGLERVERLPPRSS